MRSLRAFFFHARANVRKNCGWLADAIALTAPLMLAATLELAVAAETFAPLAPIPYAENFTDTAAFADDKPTAPERDFKRENRPLFSGKNASAKTPAAGDSAAANKSAAKNPAAPPAENRGEHTGNQTVSGAPRSASANSSAAAKRNPASSALTVVAMIAALVAIIAFLIYKHFWLRGKQLFSASALEILARTQVDRQKYFALLRVGKRLLVVGVASDNFSLLAEISDPQEAAEVMLEARPKTPSGKNLFFDLFKQHVADSNTPLPDGNFDSVQAQVKNLHHRENHPDGGKG